MPWSVAPLRLGRGWVVAPDARTLRARWGALVAAQGAERERLFGPTRSRTTGSSVAALPGRSTGTGRLARESGPCPEPVRVAYGPYDEQWLIPDHRLIDAARPELWRVADGHQLFLVDDFTVASLLPAGSPGRIRPLYRRPGGAEPNLAPGLLPYLSERYGHDVTPEDVLAWCLAAGTAAVGLPAEPGAWAEGVAWGRELLRIQLRGARGGERPRLPGGRRPYVRAPLPARPTEVGHDPEEEALLVGAGRISPVPAGAWDFHVGDIRMLDLWFHRRTTADDLPDWPQEWTSELLELITVLTLLSELNASRPELTGPQLSRADLRAAGVLPVPPAARRPASVLDHHEEGPEGQFALL
ncbi:type ISP restriction/modification enzyme [Streptomyces sp. NBC_01465]|uniref:type ISP restriction/modification enzyme n=1 Tax=Streptomyces sp. NBC_01465 TaxID=2903878 RepID=UPI002E35DE43|nr:type ISP restriction/modification enzyme [Streptomyces sp. NBC_01465]